MQVRMQQWELDMEQQTGSKLGKEYIKAVYCHPDYLTYMQGTSWVPGLYEAEAGIKIVWKNINKFRYSDDTSLMAECKEELKSLLMEVKGESEKFGLKLNILQARLQQYVNRELPDVQAGFRKGRETRDLYWNSSTWATSCEELTHWKRLWCWEGLGAGGEGDDRGWDGLMASLTRWTWI